MARRGDHARVLRLAALAAGATAALLWPTLASAEVATDGTLGAKVRLRGQDVAVPARLGQVRGGNLFHSFARFGVPRGGRVTFTGPGGLENVVGRVTGGERSEIHGTLASRVPGADLWLLNPAGILFGPDAKLDLPGAFHASSADELRFSDGAVFSALDPAGSTLSVAAPEAFGFLGAKPGAITVDRSVLEVKEGKALSLTGGDIKIRGNDDSVANDLQFADEPGTVRAEAGRVSLAALGGPGTVVAGTNEATGEVSGKVHLSGEASVISSGNGGGTIRIRGGQLVAEDSSYVFADNFGSSDAKGGVAIEAGDVLVTGGSLITADTLGKGAAGRVAVTADTIELRDIGLIGSSTFGSGNAGEVTVTADSIELRDLGSSISSNTSGPGDAGKVFVTADTIEVRGGGEVSSSTSGSGNAGEVIVTAANHLLLDGTGLWLFTGINSRAWASPGSTGHAGRVAVTADTIELRDGGEISSGTFGQGNAGEVIVTAAGHLLVDGTGSVSPTGIDSGAYFTSTGAAGRVAVTADTIEIRGSGKIYSSTIGSGDAGEVTVTAANHLLVDGTGSELFTGITSSSASVPVDGQLIVGTGDAGRVAVTADTIELRDGGAIDSSTIGPGNAGEVIVTADRMTVVDEGTVETNSEGSGTAGDVSVQVSHLVVRDGGEIGSSGTGTGAAGDVRVDAGTLEVAEASIRTEGTGAEGGQISATASDLIHLRDAEVTSSGIEPGAGTSVITLRAPSIVLDDSRVTALTGAGEPLAGSGLVQLFGDVTVISSDSEVAASSAVSVSGLENEVGSRLAVPPGVFLNAGNLLRETCAAQGQGGAAEPSRFTAAGRGGLPPDPAGPLAAPYRAPAGGRSGDAGAGPALRVAGCGPALGG